MGKQVVPRTGALSNIALIGQSGTGCGWRQSRKCVGWYWSGIQQKSRQLPTGFHEDGYLQSAEGGTRTHTPSREADFKSAASTVPPPRLLVPVRNAARGLQECKKAASGFEPLYRGFADPCLNLLATPPNQIPQQPSTTGTTFSLERKTRFELATSSLARKRSTAELLPLLSQILPLLCGLSKPNLVPRGRLELPRAHAHHPLKMACLPIPPPRHGRGGRTRTHDRRFWRPLLYQTELRPCNH